MARKTKQLSLLSTKDAYALELEKDFQHRVTEVARIRNWSVYSIPDSRRATLSGFPDLVLFRRSDGRLIFAELKREKGRLSEPQKEILDTLREISGNGRFEVYVWRPSDYEEIVKILR